jgi:Ni,Fe-hydrogenase maturation factor
LQLTPESAEIVSQFDRVIFIDAHTGNIEETLHIESLNSHYQTSPFTHHLTPQTCLALAETLYGKSPQGILVSVRGYKFGFSQELSTKTQALAAQAIGQIMKIIEQTGD